MLRGRLVSLLSSFENQLSQNILHSISIFFAFEFSIINFGNVKNAYDYDLSEGLYD